MNTPGIRQPIPLLGLVAFVLAIAVLPAGSAYAQAGMQLSVLHSFSGGDGAYLYAGLVQGSDGNFYGTTTQGGPTYDGVSDYGDGTIFKVAADGTLTSFYSFSGPDGMYPDAGLVQGADGNFFGTTGRGGVYDYGTVFKITPGGILVTLYSFSGSDGFGPAAALVEGSDGNFYGSTSGGGRNNAGTIFRITPEGALTSLYSFSGSDGYSPWASLIQGSDGSFYGTTLQGGTGFDSETGAFGFGTIFKITPDGVLTRLHSFSDTDGSFAFAGLAQGGDGDFYGTTMYGGPADDGTMYKISPEGALTTLYSFPAANGGALPRGGLLLGSDGNFYGTALIGGYGGLIYRLTPSGVVTNLYDFSVSDGYDPIGTLIQGNDGSLYGTTYYGGKSGLGEIFKLSNFDTTATPSITPASGTYSPRLQVWISDPTPYAVIYYTTDGSTPTAASTLYTGPVSIFFSKTFKAIAVTPNLAQSAVVSATYTIDRRRR